MKISHYNIHYEQVSFYVLIRCFNTSCATHFLNRFVTFCFDFQPTFFLSCLRYILFLFFMYVRMPRYYSITLKRTHWAGSSRDLVNND